MNKKYDFKNINLEPNKKYKGNAKYILENEDLLNMIVKFLNEEKIVGSCNTLLYNIHLLNIKQVCFHIDYNIEVDEKYAYNDEDIPYNINVDVKIKMKKDTMLQIDNNVSENINFNFINYILSYEEVREKMDKNIKINVYETYFKNEQG